ncbi:hypothetical protein EW093_12750 [Thiospirochaeta perfilievii]|uniref:HTH luxR-type domain-containing protein n=1 Tax=Thiospirochaeta perfilievii TaxID=252967 RepID=A0A5C1QDU1_9SPIO|nr:LuxR C-terminal-related transcriptional regulator [Thiospirochaeta perfilievii]QEN05547.1 hypothetical protein EW093_12750 [Thiospirochaeta perfilievii]
MLKPASEQRLKTAMDKFLIYKNSGNSTREMTMEQALKCKYNLTKKEIDICLLIKNGLIREDIQNKLNLSTPTLKTHLTHIYEKTELNNNREGRGDKFSQLLYLLFNL